MLLSTPSQVSSNLAPYTKYAAFFSWSLRIADVAGLIMAGVVAYWLRFGFSFVSAEYQQHIGRGVLIGLLVFGLSPLYRSWRGRGLTGELWAMLLANSAVFIASVLFAAAFKLTSDISRLWWGCWFVGSLTAGTGARLIVRGLATWTRARGLDLRSAVIVGSHKDGERVVTALERQRGAGVKMLGWFETSQCKSPLQNTPRLGSLNDLATYVEDNQIDQVWIVLPMSDQADIARILEVLAHSTADIKFVPDLLGMQLLNHSVEQFAGLPVINLRASPFDGDAQLLKAVEDRVLAMAILICILPLMALIAIAVKSTSPGPVLFRQPRHGLDGRVIEVWKFRSMEVHDEEPGTVTQATRNDSRVTRLGALLRRTSLDELPQFLNVLQGTMSIVGPRPHAVAHNHHYKALVGEYMQRHRVKPGITGWAQVNGLRGETDTLEKMAARVEHDLHYMQNWSLALDLRIIARTVVTLFRGQMAY